MNIHAKIKSASIILLLITAFAVTSLAGLQFVATAKAAGYTEYTGNLGDANFVVRFPDQWNGMLAVVCRGYSATPVLDARTSLYNSTATALLPQGFAVAASNFGPTGGFIPLTGMNSTYQLTRYLIDTYHISGKVFLVGASMGGDVVLLSAEKYPMTYSGVLDLAGVKNATESYEYKTLIASMSLPEIQSYVTTNFGAVPNWPNASLQGIKNFCNTSAADYVKTTGGTPQTKPKEYEDMSPVYHANITIPVITVHGTGDVIVPIWQTTKMYQAAVAAAGRSSLYRIYTTPPILTGTGHVDANVMAEVPGRFAELVGMSNALDGWTIMVEGRGLKAYPDLKETVWQKNATMPPNGQYDKIGLHRLVKIGITPKGVVFLTNCPTWGTGEQRISNPASDTWTKYENFSQAIYWANRGFDVYAIDYRTHFVPKTMNASQMSFAANWGLDVWVSDIKEAAEKVKAVSGAAKFFISGECTGGMAALNYATKYWRTDLKGIILLDANFFSPGYPVVGRINETNTVNLTSTINAMNAAGTWAYNPYGTLAPVAAYALQNPGASAEYPPGTPLGNTTNPLTNKTWTNITEWFTIGVQYNFGTVSASTPQGMFSNLTGGYNDISRLEYCFSNTEFLPYRIQLEAAAMVNWVNCPDLTYDYNDHYNEIGVPVIAFEAALFANRTGTFRFVNGINSTLTGVMLKNYGHTDLFFGTYSARDVSQPALAWMLNELGLTPKATAFSNATVMAGWTWNFFVHSTAGAGPYSYQWYEGTTLMAGQTKMVLPVTKNTPGIYTYYCRVTDANGATADSNSVTLTVFS